MSGMSMVELVQAVAPFTAAWHVLYWTVHIVSGGIVAGYKNMEYGFKDKKPNQKGYTQNYWCSTIVSIVHSLTMAALCVPFVMKEPNWIWEANIEDTRDELALANKVFLAYICNDLLFVLPWAIKLGKLDDVAFVAHHLSIIAVWVSFITQGWGDMFSLPTLITELTGMFIGARFVMIKVGLGSSTLFMVNGVVMLTSWWYLRIWGYVVRLAIILYKETDSIYLNPVNDTFVRNVLVSLCWVLGSGLQLMWGYTITMGAYGVVFPKKGKTEKSKE
uniref:TLC domain-containing protein n=1 Tax=Florenciella parvula TaxID=236787 RepID=A0A6T7H127_9STRA